MANNKHIDVDNLLFARDWTRNLLHTIDDAKSGSEPIDMDSVIRQCSSICYQNKHMDDLLEGFGTLDEFFAFLTGEWNWILTYHADSNILLCDENKNECICPVVKACNGDISVSMCCCTEGMLRQIFEKMFKRSVNTKLVTSVLRGGKSCVYEIYIDDLTADEVTFLSQYQEPLQP